MRLLSDRKGIQRTKVHPPLLTKPEEVCLRWEVSWRGVTPLRVGKRDEIQAGRVLALSWEDKRDSMWSSFSRMVFPGLRSMAVQRRGSCVMHSSSMRGYSSTQGRPSPATCEDASDALQSCEHVAEGVSQHPCEEIPPRLTSAGVALGSGHSAGIERRRISFKACYFRRVRLDRTSHHTPRFGSRDGTVIGCLRQTP